MAKPDLDSSIDLCLNPHTEKVPHSLQDILTVFYDNNDRVHGMRQCLKGDYSLEELAPGKEMLDLVLSRAERLRSSFPFAPYLALADKAADTRILLDGIIRKESAGLLRRFRQRCESIRKTGLEELPILREELKQDIAAYGALKQAGFSSSAIENYEASLKRHAYLASAVGKLLGEYISLDDPKLLRAFRTRAKRTIKGSLFEGGLLHECYGSGYREGELRLKGLLLEFKSFDDEQLISERNDVSTRLKTMEYAQSLEPAKDALKTALSILTYGTLKPRIFDDRIEAYNKSIGKAKNWARQTILCCEDYLRVEKHEWERFMETRESRRSIGDYRKWMERLRESREMASLLGTSHFGDLGYLKQEIERLSSGYQARNDLSIPESASMPHGAADYQAQAQIILDTGQHATPAKIQQESRKCFSGSFDLVSYLDSAPMPKDHGLLKLKDILHGSTGLKGRYERASAARDYCMMHGTVGCEQDSLFLEYIVQGLETDMESNWRDYPTGEENLMSSIRDSVSVLRAYSRPSTSPRNTC